MSREIFPSWGEFSFSIRGKRKGRKCNTMTKDGAALFLQSLFCAGDVLPASYYLGVCNCEYSFDTTLVDVAATEPSGNGYARVAIARDNTHWTLTKQNNYYMAESARATFTATADWDKPWRQMFLCDAAAGTSGHLIAVSARWDDDIYVEAGVPPVAWYRFYLRGKAVE